MESAQLEHAQEESRTDDVRRTSLKTLRVENFKSFEKIDLTLPDFSIFVGPNGSGKSNLIDAMRFPYDIASLGLDGAISKCGGNRSIRPLGAKEKADLAFEFQIESSVPCPGSFPLGKNEHITLGISSMTCRFKLDLKDKSGYTVLYDEAEFEGNIFDDDSGIGKRAKISVTNDNGALEFVHDGQEKYVQKNEIISSALKKSGLMLHSNVLFRQAIIQMFERAISVYNIYPKYAKRPVSSDGPPFLSPDASNLALAIQKLSDDPEKMRVYEVLVNHLIPSVSKIGTEKSAYDQILFNFQEKYFGGTPTPSNLVSDGSASAAAIIMALYFQDTGLRIIEEPERAIHPSLAHMLVHLIKEASPVGQVLLTTHNPDILRCADIGDIYMVSRGDDGISTIAKPHDVQAVKELLDADMGIDDMHRHNLLENS